MSAIFDDIERTDMSPKRHTETDFVFLNRSARPEFTTVRGFLEDLMAEYPEGERAEAVARIRSGDDDAFRSATFELILHGQFRRLGAELECHPEVPGSTGRPDFKVSLPDESFFYLEASGTATHDGTDAGAEARKAVVYDAVNRIDSPKFFLDVRSQGAPTTPPGSKPMRKALKEWVGNLDPDAVAEIVKAKGYAHAPTFEWTYEDWRLTFRAIPKSPDNRSSGDRSIGTYSDGVKQIDDWTPIRDRVMAKGNRYGGELDAPLIVAINAGSFNVDKIDVMQALFGQESFTIHDGDTQMERLPNGAWHGPDGPRYSRISGVLIYNDMKPSNVATRKHSLYINPSATRPVPTQLLILPHHAPEEAKLKEKPGESLRSLFGMSEEWPENVA